MSWEPKRIAIVGAGAIGLYYGGRLAVAGEDVSFLMRSDYPEVSRNGLKVESVHGDFVLERPQVFRSSEEIGAVDLVIVSWKTTSNHLLAEVLPPLLHEGTQVLTLQNGLGNCETIAEIVGEDRVLGALCFVCINRLRPGLVSHSGGGRITIGEWTAAHPGRAEEITSRFQAAGIRAATTANLVQSQWEKLIWNVPFNGLSVAEGGVTTDVLLSSKPIEEEIRALMEEVVRAAHGLGLSIDEGLIEKNIESTRPMGAYRTSSMIDYVEGREVEVGPIWREPLERARAIGVSMPRLERLLGRIEECLAKRGGG